MAPAPPTPTPTPSHHFTSFPYAGRRHVISRLSTVAARRHSISQSFLLASHSPRPLRPLTPFPHRVALVAPVVPFPHIQPHFFNPSTMQTPVLVARSFLSFFSVCEGVSCLSGPPQMTAVIQSNFLDWKDHSLGPATADGRPVGNSSERHLMAPSRPPSPRWHPSIQSAQHHPAIAPFITPFITPISSLISSPPG